MTGFFHQLLKKCNTAITLRSKKKRKKKELNNFNRESKLVAAQNVTVSVSWFQSNFGACDLYEQHEALTVWNGKQHNGRILKEAL